MPNSGAPGLLPTQPVPATNRKNDLADPAPDSNFLAAVVVMGQSKAKVAENSHDRPPYAGAGIERHWAWWRALALHIFQGELELGRPGDLDELHAMVGELALALGAEQLLPPDAADRTELVPDIKDLFQSVPELRAFGGMQDAPLEVGKLAADGQIDAFVLHDIVPPYKDPALAALASDAHFDALCAAYRDQGGKPFPRPQCLHDTTLPG